MRRYVPAVLLAVAFSASALANDSTAELSTGGLLFVHSDSLEMQSEDLFISRSEVRVHYKFLNTSKADITTLVAFPMPDITVENDDFTTDVPSGSQENILDFKTLADGKPVPAQVQQRVFAFGVDRTDFLRQLHIPLGPHLEATGKALDALPKDRWDEFVRLGLADISEYGDTAKGMQKHLAARWTLKTTYFWQQTFPAGRGLAIDHQYTPSVGGTVQAMLGADYAKTDASYPDYLRKYCVDADLRKGVEQAVKIAGDGHIAFSEQRISYILKTANNWDGPIKDFRLVIDRGEPTTLVSFCGDHVKKISPAQFEMRKTDFSPDKDLDILFLVKGTT